MAKRILIASVVVILLVTFGYQLFSTKMIYAESPQGPNTCSEPLDMALVKGGSFTTGAGAVYPEELPAIKREVQDFYTDRHEVTNAQFT
jgi:formylglycine-generating enzyme required for sulfatase activity